MEKLFAAVDAHAAEYRKLLEDIVCIESESHDKPGVDAVGSYIKKFAQDRGMDVTVVPFERAGDALLITCNEGSPLPPVAFTGHMDTVFPKGTFSQPLFREEDGKFFGPGVYDMKGGIAVGLLTMQALMETGCKRPLRMALIGDEEVSEGLSGEAGKQFIKDSVRGCAAAITMECGNVGRVTVGRKGSVRYRVTVHGRAAHAGMDYDKGISAVREAAHKIIDIEAPSTQADITYNCGLIEGGTSANTVPGTCTFVLQNRYWKPEQRQKVCDHIEGILDHQYLPGTHAEFEIIGERPPMVDTPDNYRLAAHIDKTARKYGFGAREPYMSHGGSDAAYTTQVGIPSVCSMGLTGANPHAVTEWAQAASLPEQAKLLAAAVAEMPEDF